MTELCYSSAVDLAARIRARELSPVELAEALLQRIDEHDGRVNAFAHLAGDLLLDAARRAEREVMAGTPLGPLHGVPVTIKDLHELEGYPFEQGSRCKAGTTGDADCPVAARLKAAGAVILGKTTTSEFGWCGVSRSPLTGITHNPWRHGFNAGASSAGAGAAATAGFGPLHQGSDGAGSIRMPSHFCGVFGFKPTWGLVPHVPVRNNDQVSHVGPISRTVADAALFLNATTGPHPYDHTSLLASGTDCLDALDIDVAKLKIAFSPDLGHARVDPEVAGLVETAVRLFEAFDCTVEVVTPFLGSRWPGDWPVLLGRPRITAGRPPGGMGSGNGPRSCRLHPGRLRTLGRDLPRDAG